MNEVARRIETHLPALHRYALSLARNSTGAEELVQECVVRALAKAHLYKPGTNLRAWLFTILHNLHVSEIRRENNWKRPSDPEAALALLFVPPTQMASVMLHAVGKAMGSLPEQQRSILYSVGVEGKSYEEVSAELSIPVGTVKSRCSRARQSLHSRIDDVARPAAA